MYRGKLFEFKKQEILWCESLEYYNVKKKQTNKKHLNIYKLENIGGKG